MNSPRSSLLRVLGAALVAVGCTPVPSVPGAVGLTESDRIELVADRAEPIVDIRVREGDTVEAGAVLLVLDPARVEARLAQARAQADQARAYHEELIEGPRAETITEQRARLNGAEHELRFRATEFERLSALLSRGLTSVEARDQARAALDAARAAQEAAAARLAELEAGTRPEQLRQAEQAWRQAIAAVAALEVDLARLTVRAPAEGVVDSLPFEPGEQPAAGQVVAVVLAGSQAYARVYVPEQWRLGIAPGTTAEVRVDGLDRALPGRVRRIESAATFTPYYALTERDRGRLSYVAEVDIEGLDRRLPDGVPVTVTFPDR